MTRLWPGSLLGRNLLLLVLLVVASDISTFTIFFAFIQLPRIDEAAALFASQTKQVARLLSVLPPEIRYSELVATNGGEQAPPAGTDTPTHSFSAHRFLQTLTRHLPPGTRISLDGGKDSRQIWIQLRINDQLDWIMLPVPAEINHQLPWSVIAQLFTIAAFPALGAWLIQRYTVVRLQRLARAATTVTHGGWPEPVPVDGPSEFITVASTFNQMVASLAEMDATRTEMLAGISHDIRTPLTNCGWRLRRRRRSRPHLRAQSTSSRRLTRLWNSSSISREAATVSRLCLGISTRWSISSQRITLASDTSSRHHWHHCHRSPSSQSACKGY